MSGETLSSSDNIRTLRGITLWSRLRASRGYIAFLVLAACAPLIVVGSIIQLDGLLRASDIGFETNISSRDEQRVAVITDRWPELRVDDQIVSLNGVPTPTIQTFWDAERAVTAGLVTLEVLRGGQRLEVKGKALPPESRSTWQVMAMALRLLTGAMLLLIAIASFLIQPGTRQSWLHFSFMSLLGTLLLLFGGEATRAYDWVYTFALPIMVTGATCGLIFFSDFPRPVFSERVRSLWWVLAVLVLALEIGFIVTQRSESVAVSQSFEIACRLYSALAALGMIAILVVGAREAQAVEGTTGDRLRATYRLLIWSAAIGLGFPGLSTLVIRVVWGGSLFFEAMVVPVIVFAAGVGWAIIRHNALNADKYTASVLGYVLSISGAGVVLVVAFVGFPWLLRTIDSRYSREVLVGVVVALLTSIGRVAGWARRKLDRWFKRTSFDPRDQALVLRTLVDRLSVSSTDDAFYEVMRTLISLGADRVEVWLADQERHLFTLRAARSSDAASSDRSIPRSEELPLNDPIAAAIGTGAGGVPELSPKPYPDDAQATLWNRLLACAVPLKANGKVAGFLGVGRKSSGFKYTADELGFFEVIAAQLTVTLERGDAFRHVGRYRIERRLNAGGSAEVFLAWQMGVGGFEKRVVIKRLLPHLTDDARAAAMLLDEARITARLQHPNIVEVFEVGAEKGNYFIAMELVTGRSLRELITAVKRVEGTVPLGVVSAVARAVLSALQHGHELKAEDGKHTPVVHRDVTPANVMITAHGGVKLLDFGLALDREREYQTSTGVIRGTVPFMSPEQAQQKSIDGRSDVFSAAATLYELLTMVRAFPDGPLMGTALAPSRYRSDAPRADEVFKKAFELDPAQRYPTAEALSRALADALGPASPSEEVKAWLDSVSVAPAK